MQIYPAIDLRGGQCVRLEQGDYARETVFSADPVAVARQFAEAGATQLHLVDLDGAKAGRPVNGEAVRQIVSAIDIPVQLGGGIRTADDLDAVVGWGVRWAVVGSQALKNPAFLEEQATRFPERLVLGLDARDGMVATEGWLETSATAATELVARFAVVPLYAVVYTDIARDGMLTGPNLIALAEMIAATPHRVIASGGVGTATDVAAIRQTQAFGVIVGRAIYEGRVSLGDLLVHQGA